MQDSASEAACRIAGRGRRALVHGAIAVVIGASLAATVSGAEWWPFSRYAMYAHRQPPTTTSIRVMGVTEDGGQLWLDDVNRVLAPMGGQRLEGTFSRLPPHSPERRVVARWVWARYVAWDASRPRGRRLRGVRIYRARWTIVPRAANVARPDALQLLAVWRAW